MTNRRKYKPNPSFKAIEIIQDEWNKEDKEIDNTSATYAASFILIVMIFLIVVTSVIISLL